MYQYKLLPIFLFLTLLFSACRKDNTTTEVERIPPEVQVNIESTIQGYVTDKNGMPIPDARVTVFNESKQTNEYGFFKITGLVNELQALIKVEKTGYFNQFRSLIPSEEAVDRTRFQLVEKNTPQTILATTGGEVTILGETTVAFQVNGFIDEFGNPYNGDVNVYSYFIDPTASNADEIMPGSLLARNMDDELNVLQSFGMVNVVLEGSGGQQLDINKPATLTIAVPSAISNNAPAEIPLWYFDEEIGIWKEEGSAFLSAGKYVGTVNHFTFWNCDVPLEFFTLLSGQVISEAGVPVVKVRITDPNSGISAADWTDENGNFDGYVPKDTELLLEILDECNATVLHSETIGPFSEEETDLGIIDLFNNSDLIEVSGTLVDCIGDPISNGQVILSLPGQFYPTQTETAMDGTFSIVTSACGSAEVEILVIDFDNSIINDPVTYPVAADMALGDIEICNGNGTSFAASVTFIYDNVTKVIPNVMLTIIPQPPSASTMYKFEFIDENAGPPGEAPANYDWTFIDFNNDLDNPNFSYVVNADPPSVIVDSVTVYGALAITNQNTEVVQQANVQGEIMTIQFSDCLIGTETYYSNGDVSTTFFEGTAIFSGELQ